MAGIFIKCSNCKFKKNIETFMVNNRQLKTCSKCRSKNRLAKSVGRADGAKCECGLFIIFCSIHNDNKRILIRNIINQSKNSDAKHFRLDKNQFIDEQFVSNLLQLYKKCFYCNCILNYGKRNPQLATIERLDNTLGHIKRNCVIACFSCNVNHVGDKYN